MQAVTHSLAREDNGNLQINFTVPFDLIKKGEEAVIAEEASSIQVPGFRKGMAPKDKAREKMSPEDLLQKTLSRILPQALSEVISKEKLALALYPKFELVKTKENEAWQIRAISCEQPSIKLGNYLQKSTKQLKEEEKETFVIQQIIKSTEAKIAPLLITEEVNARLANLLQRIEHLGLDLDKYLSSINKTPDSLRAEYQKQATEAIILEVALDKIADEKKITVKKDKIDQAIKAASTDPKMAEELKKPEKQKVLASILRRQETISYLKNRL